MSVPLLEVEAVEKRFGHVLAVGGVSFAVAENQFFALLGPSGCGKTTLLRVIAGFERPDSGRIRLDGRDITQMRPSRRPLNMMFQSYALFPHLSVYANVAYGLEMEGVRGAALKRRVGEALEMVQLADLADRRPHRLSGGQRQRVALARALVKRPRVLLLDEPLAALDRKLREQMQLELKRLQHETGIAFVVVTHDQQEALVMADRIALLQEGRIAQLDTPRTLYERPASRFVARFIGLMNLIEGRLSAGGVEVAGLGILPGEAGPGILRAGEGSPAALAVRPERVRLSLAGAEGPAGIAGRIASVAYLGQDLLVHVAVAGQAAPLVARLIAGDPLAEALQPGTAVRCSWSPADARILID